MARLLMMATLPLMCPVLNNYLRFWVEVMIRLLIPFRAMLEVVRTMTRQADSPKTNRTLVAKKNRLVGKTTSQIFLTEENSFVKCKCRQTTNKRTVLCLEVPNRVFDAGSAQLLRDRKQNPTTKWLKELPYKARKLEEQLYKTAPSLEAYLDKQTLKHRLKKVAHAITSQFRLAKGGKTMSRRRSSKSRSSITSETSTGSTGSANAADMSALEQQQAVNQKLQEQILENIRQQQQIMRNLMQQPNQQQPQQLQQQQQQDPTANMMAAAVQQQSPMNLNMTNPLMMQQAFMGGGMVRGATPQMAMMNPLLRNQLNPAALNTGMMGMNPMGNVIPPQPMNAGMNSSIHPTMPPPNMASLRSSFSNGAGNPNGTDDNTSLSPNSFKW